RRPGATPGPPALRPSHPTEDTERNPTSSSSHENNLFLLCRGACLTATQNLYTRQASERFVDLRGSVYRALQGRTRMLKQFRSCLALYTLALLAGASIVTAQESRGTLQGRV